MKHIGKKISCFVLGEGVEGHVIAFWWTSKLETSKSQFCCKVTITWLSGGIFCLVLKMFSETHTLHCGEKNVYPTTVAVSLFQAL